MILMVGLSFMGGSVFLSVYVLYIFANGKSEVVLDVFLMDVSTSMDNWLSSSVLAKKSKIEEAVNIMRQILENTSFQPNRYSSLLCFGEDAIELVSPKRTDRKHIADIENSIASYTHCSKSNLLNACNTTNVYW